VCEVLEPLNMAPNLYRRTASGNWTDPLRGRSVRLVSPWSGPAGRRRVRPSGGVRRTMASEWLCRRQIGSVGRMPCRWRLPPRREPETGWAHKLFGSTVRDPEGWWHARCVSRRDHARP